MASATGKFMGAVAAAAMVAALASPSLGQITPRPRDPIGGHDGTPVDPPSPRSCKLEAFASGIYHPHGQAILQVIGDSINAPNRPSSMQIGYRDRLEVPFNGWVVHADNGNADIGYMNAQGEFSEHTVRNPWEVFSNGLTAFSPVRVREAVWGQNVAFGGTLSDCYILNSNMWEMKLGNPFAGSAVVDARLLMFEGQTQLGGFLAVGIRGNTEVTVGAYQRPSPVAGRIV
jgi:hypothetical protein